MAEWLAGPLWLAFQEPRILHHGFLPDSAVLLLFFQNEDRSENLRLVRPVGKIILQPQSIMKGARGIYSTLLDELSLERDMNMAAMAFSAQLLGAHIDTEEPKLLTMRRPILAGGKVTRLRQRKKVRER